MGQNAVPRTKVRCWHNVTHRAYVGSPGPLWLCHSHTPRTEGSL